MSTHATRDPRSPPRDPSGRPFPAPDLFRLENRTILITGGGGAMGLHVARTCLELGADVVCIDRMARPLGDLWEQARAVADVLGPGREIDGKHGTAEIESAGEDDGVRSEMRLKYMSLDIGMSNERSTEAESTAKDGGETIRLAIRRICESVREGYPVRGLVCCAGISDGGEILGFSTERTRRLFETNVFGTLECIKAVAERMRGEYQKQSQQPQNVQRDQGYEQRLLKSTSGSIVVIASMSGHVANLGVDTASYNASKAALHQLTRSLAAEWGSRPGMPLIRVNSVSPGYIRTRMTEETLREEGMEKLWSEGNMLGRISEADEYRGVVCFLLGEGSSFITGTDVRVDGGHTAW